MATPQKTTQTADIVQPVEKAVAAGKEQFESILKANNETVTKQYEQAVAITKEHLDKASKAAFQSYDEVIAFNKANVEAVVQSGTIAAQGLGTLTRRLLDVGSSQLESNLATAKKLAGVTTPRELFELQADYVRQSFDQVLAESAKVTELGTKVANDALAPIQSQTHAVVEKAVKPAA